MDCILIVKSACVSSVLLFFIGAIGVSIKENENSAALKIAFSGLAAAGLFFVPLILGQSFAEIYSYSLWSVALLSAIILLFPIRGKSFGEDAPKGQIDERDTMFSRRELVPDTEKFEEYYSNNPEALESDTTFRAKPGLLQKGASHYDPVLFSSADASFDTVGELKGFVDGEISGEKVTITPEQMSQFIKQWSRKLGAVDCGTTDLQNYHLYSVGGRGERYGKPVVNNHKSAIAFTVEMSKEMIDSAPKGSVVMESAQQYLESGTVAVQVAALIRNLGYSARAHIDGNYQVVCPLVARDAGLGEIGRMGLLMTPKLGPRVRISVVTTDMPLTTDAPQKDSSVIDFCTICKKCADACPSKAISFGAKENIDGVNRWQINSEKCFTTWCTFGTDCARCIAVCPYSHPDNSFHTIVRWGIRNSFNFRRFALWMDDFFYGRKPKSKPMPGWMKTS